MASFQNPRLLNEAKRYSQACTILRSTSRARNKAWFQEALDLDYQLHLRSEGGAIMSRIFDRRSGDWSDGPAVLPEVLRDNEKAAAFAQQIIELARQARANAIGVILYLADEFATAELRSEYDNPADLPELRATAESDPTTLFEGASTSSDEQSYRLFPYPAAGGEAIAAGITLSKQHGAFFDQIRAVSEEENFPIIAHALSAPLVALLAVPEAAKPTPNKPFMTVLYYSPFTVIAFFNEHGDLRLLRTIQHRGQRRPLNLRDITTTTLAALEISDPDVFIFPLTRTADPTVLVELQSKFTKSRVDTIDWTQTPFSHQNIPAYSPELLIATRQPSETMTGFSSTYESLVTEKWVQQNFLPVPQAVAEIYPTLGEVKLLRTVGLARVAVALVALLAIAWALFGLFSMTRQPAWAFEPREASTIQKRVATLTQERQQIEHWDNLLEDRSKGWTAMELLSRLFPENSGILVKSFNHTTRPEPAPGKAKVGFVKEWRIAGYTREEGLEKLNTINSRDGINAIFTEVAKVTGNEAYRPDVGNRSVLVNVRLQENSSFRARANEEPLAGDATSYRHTFDLTITQRFEASDPLALNVSKAP